MGAILQKKYQNLVISKFGKKSLKIVKLEVNKVWIENFEHLLCIDWSWKFYVN